MEPNKSDAEKEFDGMSADSGYVRTNPYNQTIDEGKVDVYAQDYVEPPAKK